MVLMEDVNGFYKLLPVVTRHSHYEYTRMRFFVKLFVFTYPQHFQK